MVLRQSDALFNRKHDTILAYVKNGDYTFSTWMPYVSRITKIRSRPSMPLRKLALARCQIWIAARFPKIGGISRLLPGCITSVQGIPRRSLWRYWQRIILASSNPGDLVADFFCGSGTTSFVAAKHGRTFLACDQMFRALHTARTRLAGLQTVFTPGE